MSEMVALLLFFQDMSRTPQFALGENTKRGGWEDHKEHLTRRKIRFVRQKIATILSQTRPS
jgi:hypothetical protein